MMLSNPIRYDVSLTPSEVLARLASATVPWEEVANLRQPLQSYKTFLVESLFGPKEFTAQIAGQTFRIVPLGGLDPDLYLWPWLSKRLFRFKRRSWTAPVGSMKGQVIATSQGARIEARFRVFPALVVVPIVYFSFLALIGGSITIMALNIDPSGVVPTLALVGGMAVFGLLFGMIIWLAARGQRRLIADFLHRLFGEFTGGSPADR